MPAPRPRPSARRRRSTTPAVIVVLGGLVAVALGSQLAGLARIVVIGGIAITLVAATLLPRRRTRAVIATAIIGVCVAIIGANLQAGSDALPDAPAGSAAAVLGEIPVAKLAARTGYDREAFGYRTVDLDRNGCDIRNDVLARDLRDVIHGPGTNGCRVDSGVLTDPYSGSDIPFTRGQGTSEAVQIDHVVALSNAWQTGAAAWDESTRLQFANDPLNLLAVSGPLNSAKGDADAARWLPPDPAFACPYVARQVTVKAAYGLWVTPSERAAMARVLRTCPEEPLAGR